MDSGDHTLVLGGPAAPSPALLPSVPKEIVSRTSLPDTWLQLPVTARGWLVLVLLVINHGRQERISLNNEGRGWLWAVLLAMTGPSTVLGDI